MMVRRFPSGSALGFPVIGWAPSSAGRAVSGPAPTGPPYDASITFVSQPIWRASFLAGTSADRNALQSGEELAGQGKAVWAATDLGGRAGSTVGRRRRAGGSAAGSSPTAGCTRSSPRAAGSSWARRMEPPGSATRSGSNALRRSTVTRHTPCFLRVTRSGPVLQRGCSSPCPARKSGAPGRAVFSQPAGRWSTWLRSPIPSWRSLGISSSGAIPAAAEWTLGPNLSGLLGRLRRFVADREGFWVAGDRGVGFARLTTPPLRPLREGDLPGAANDLAVDEEYLWVATDGGLVRFRLNVIRP